jgi:hypothetical protein
MKESPDGLDEVRRALPQGSTVVQQPDTQKSIVDALLLFKVAGGTVHQAIVRPEQWDAIFKYLKETGIAIVSDPVPFDWVRAQDAPVDEKR